MSLVGQLVAIVAEVRSNRLHEPIGDATVRALGVEALPVGGATVLQIRTGIRHGYSIARSSHKYTGVCAAGRRREARGRLSLESKE